MGLTVSPSFRGVRVSTPLRLEFTLVDTLLRLQSGYPFAARLVNHNMTLRTLVGEAECLALRC